MVLDFKNVHEALRSHIGENDTMRIQLVGDRNAVSTLTNLINEAYKDGEAGIMVDDKNHRFFRVTEEDVLAAITDAKILELRNIDDGNILGCIQVSKVHDNIAEWGCLAVAKEYQGKGLGSKLVWAAEEHIKTILKCQVAQLQLLAPSDWKHSHKERLREWYLRMGYQLAKGSYEESTIRLPCHSRLGNFIVMATNVDCTTYHKHLHPSIVDQNKS
jgi:ribosomal protein S18 acetylase RimI-like enzyme